MRLELSEGDVVPMHVVVGSLVSPVGLIQEIEYAVGA